jgi:hypothetical protein
MKDARKRREPREYAETIEFDDVQREEKSSYRRHDEKLQKSFLKIV